MYKLIRIASYLVRQIFFPNPFSNMFSDVMAECVNYIAGGIIVYLAYNLTRTWYISKKGEYWKGSLGFLVNYFILTEGLLVISKYIHNIYIIVIIYIILFIILCLIEHKLLGKKFQSF